MNDSIAHTKGRARVPLAHPDHATHVAHADADTTIVPRLAPDAGAHGVEPWAKLLLLSLVPAIAALYVPHAVKLALFAVTGVLFIAAMVLLVRQERDRPAPRRD